MFEVLCLSTQPGYWHKMVPCICTQYVTPLCEYLLYFALSDATLKHIYSREWVCKAMAYLRTNRKSVQTGNWYPLLWLRVPKIFSNHAGGNFVHKYKTIEFDKVQSTTRYNVDPNKLNKLKRVQKLHPLKSQGHDLILLMPHAWYLHSGVGSNSDSLLRISKPQFNGSPFNKNSSLKVWKFHAPNGKVHSS